MTDTFYPIPLNQLLQRILDELNTQTEVLGLPKDLLVNPNKFSEIKTSRFGKTISTPYGVAAGPHTQMAQNIVAAWLFGARYIELKTIQTLDELEVSKPCIDMQDEGYNCEWSQELKIQQSFNEYLNAWIIIHVLNHHLGWGSKPETIFNMSVGYDLQGILKENVQWFFAKMNDCSAELEDKKNALREIYPAIDQIEIPAQLSNNITLSTMHGCPAHEIEEIARYLIEEKKLHTIVKLNPTLLGANDLRSILNDKLAWPVQVPDIAFEHDLKYPDALKIIQNLQAAAHENKVHFGLKLTNTLEVENEKGVFDESQQMMYMSGRSLHAISINLAARLQNEFKGTLDISFSAGADAYNIAAVLQCGMQPVTVSSDLLKPGGYSRMAQYAEKIQKKQAQISNNKEKSQEFLNNYAQEVLQDKRYAYQIFEHKDIKTQRSLNTFDCIAAPCTDTCPTNQNIPDYLHYAAQGDFQKSFEVILRNNAFPQTLGMVCEHSCQTKCTRINYDNPLQIREIKNFVSQQGKDDFLKPAKANGLSIGIIGAGPAGLSAAYFLALEGFKVEIFEQEDGAGGMVHKAIPKFRMPNNALYDDIARIEKLGVKIQYNTSVDQAFYEKMKDTYNYVYIAIGAQLMKPLNIPGIDNNNVLNPLSFLHAFKQNTLTHPGNHVLIIGGGNTAMDVARAAKKVQNGQGEVSIVYRRSLAQMPADAEEIEAAKAEGIRFLNLLSPLEIKNTQQGLSLSCQPMRLSNQRGSDGRLKVEVDPAKNLVDLEATSIIPAIGQEVQLDLHDADIELLLANKTRLGSGKLFLGGDARHGAASVVQAVGDGQQMAKEIIALAKLEHQYAFDKETKNISAQQHLVNRAHRKYGEANPHVLTTAQQIQEEAARCLACDEYCNICVSVCPNRANYSYTVEPQAFNLPKISINNGNHSLLPGTSFAIAQAHQVLNIADFCNECGNCTTFCPTAGEPYKDKPHVYLTKESYNDNSEGYFLEKHNNSLVLTYKNNETGVSLEETDNHFIYYTNALKVCFNKQTFSINEVQVKSSAQEEIDLQKAAEMRFILEGAKALNGVS